MHNPTVSAVPRRVRAGSRALSIFAYSLNATVLRAHTEGPLSLGELEEKIGWASQSSLRASVGKMCEIGAMARLDDSDGPQRSVACELTYPGHELLLVADTLEHWLRLAPGGAVALDHPAAHGIVRVLTAGWDSAIVRAIAERPLSLAELDAGNTQLSYPALKRRLAKLRTLGLVAPVKAGAAAGYAASGWLRRAMAPIAVASRWEHLHDPDSEPVSRTEVEAAFLLTLPLLQLPDRASGACTLAILTSDRETASDGGAQDALASVEVEVEKGAVASVATSPSSEPASWALGSMTAWYEALIDDRTFALRIGGVDPDLPRSLVEGIHSTLVRFG